MFQIWQKGLCRRDQGKDPEMRDYPGLSSSTQCSHKGPYKTESNVKEAEGHRERLGGMTVLALKMEDGPSAKEGREPLKAGKGKETGSSLKHPEGMQLS